MRGATDRSKIVPVRIVFQSTRPFTGAMKSDRGMEIDLSSPLSLQRPARLRPALIVSIHTRGETSLHLAEVFPAVPWDHPHDA
jgi:hypothetical protein